VAVLLHSSGGNLCEYDYNFGSDSPWRSAANHHGYILATIHARPLAGYERSNNRQTLYLNGPLAPSQQDTLDALPVITSRHLIDPNRIYLAGYSMGGIGTMNIVTQNPGIFAAA